jgi:hypothetical protein
VSWALLFFALLLTPAILVPWFTPGPFSTGAGLLQLSLSLSRPTCFGGNYWLIVSCQKGYEADNKNIQLLRLRSFTLGRPVADATLTNADDAQERIADLVSILEPWVCFFSS